jgi:hypothetical protein
MLKINSIKLTLISIRLLKLIFIKLLKFFIKVFYSLDNKINI